MMKFNLSHRLLALAITISTGTAFCPEIKAQNIDVFNNRWGWNQGQQYNNGSNRGGWNQSHDGYNTNIINYDNNRRTHQWGGGNSQFQYHQSGNCQTGNCSHSSSYNTNSSHRSRTSTR